MGKQARRGTVGDQWLRKVGKYSAAVERDES